MNAELGEIKEKKESFSEEIDTPEKMREFLEDNKEFSQRFVLQKGNEKDLVQELDSNEDNFIYRGMDPNKVLDLMRGETLHIAPYRYENIDPNYQPAEELQNASYLYSNAIPHGHDADVTYNFLAAVGFDPHGLGRFIVKGTGRQMANRLFSDKDVDAVPANREYDVSVEGDLNPDNIQVYCFRFGAGKKAQTLVYRRKNALNSK